MIRDGFTAFIGANNSGKSTILRLLFEFRYVLQVLSNTADGNFQNLVRGGSTGLSIPAPIRDPHELFNDGNDRGMSLEISVAPDLPGETAGTPITHAQIGITRGTPTVTLKLNRDMVFGQPQQIGFGAHWIESPAGKFDLRPINEVCIKLANSLYIGPFRNAINVGTNQNYFDIQVGKAFIEQWRELQAGGSRLAALTTYKLVEDLRRIFGFRRLEIVPSADAETLQVVIDGKPYKLYELGAGLAQFLVVLVNAANRKPAFILIDEPELNLHPALQLDFLTSLTSYAQSGVLFATHSIGLARASAERIYTTKRLDQGDSELTEYGRTPRLSELVGELSFSGYQELGFDRILLVEGSTDVKVMQQFLRKYGKDHQIVIMPMGGRGTINGMAEEQLLEITRITPNVCAVVDSERSSAASILESRIVDFQAACARAGVNCKVLDRRATENYLADTAVRTIKGPAYRALGPYERLDEMQPNWSKRENWRIASAMNKSDLDSTDLGSFLQGI